MSHFTSFTPEGMRSFRQTLDNGTAQRQEFVANLFSTSQRERREAEHKRQLAAAQNADARRLFVSELRSGVHALRSRFGLARRDMVADFQLMASELQAARQAFHNGHNGHNGRHNYNENKANGSQPHRTARPAYTPPPRPNPFEPAAREANKAAATHAAAPAEKTNPDKPHADNKPEYPKKRHG